MGFPSICICIEEHVLLIKIRCVFVRKRCAEVFSSIRRALTWLGFDLGGFLVVFLMVI